MDLFNFIILTQVASCYWSQDGFIQLLNQNLNPFQYSYVKFCPLLKWLLLTFNSAIFLYNCSFFCFHRCVLYTSLFQEMGNLFHFEDFFVKRVFIVNLKQKYLHRQEAFRTINIPRQLSKILGRGWKDMKRRRRKRNLSYWQGIKNFLINLISFNQYHYYCQHHHFNRH